MKKGDIFYGKKEENAIHPIIFIEKIDDESFKGAIITHGKNAGNIPMKQQHFEKVDENGVRYEVQYDESYLVPYSFIKMNNWVKAKVVGRLTEAGIAFVEKHLTQKCVYHPKPIWAGLTVVI